MIIIQHTVLSAPVGGGFSPADISGLRLWVDAAVGVTETTGKVSGWADQSSDGRDFAQSNSGFRPVLVTGVINSLPVIRIAPGEKLEATTIDFTAYCSIFIVGALTTITGDAGIIQQQDCLAIRAMEGSSYASAYTWADLSARGFGGGTVNNTNPFVLHFQYYSGLQTLYRNGPSVGSDTAQTGDLATVTNPFFLGVGYGSNFDGDIAEVICYDSDLTSTDRDNVTTYLGDKYGITIT